ncbi:MAG: hypothetical protein H7Y20_03805 [Bryobacteraceae bacterium]|nr:hypothetical protein [Bryobacteraceae bacterium]
MPESSGPPPPDPEPRDPSDPQPGSFSDVFDLKRFETEVQVERINRESASGSLSISADGHEYDWDGRRAFTLPNRPFHSIVLKKGGVEICLHFVASAEQLEENEKLSTRYTIGKCTYSIDERPDAITIETIEAMQGGAAASGWWTRFFTPAWKPSAAIVMAVLVLTISAVMTKAPDRLTAEWQEKQSVEALGRAGQTGTLILLTPAAKLPVLSHGLVLTGRETETCRLVSDPIQQSNGLHSWQFECPRDVAPGRYTAELRANLPLGRWLTRAIGRVTVGAE